MISAAISPCPNDTFLFAAWAEGRVGKLRCELQFLDIDRLNRLGKQREAPLIKLSAFAFADLQDSYEMLNVGAAIGFGVGPKLVSAAAELDLNDENLRVVLPGRETTAHFLFSLFFPHLQNKHYLPYHEIEDSVREGLYDVGVIIHESRFSYAQKGLFSPVDLGELWHERFELPLPLGLLAVKKDMSSQLKEQIELDLEASLRFAHNHFEAIYPFIEERAQEKNREQIEKHIALYVTEESMSLSEQGVRAIETFLRLAVETHRLCHSH